MSEVSEIIVVVGLTGCFLLEIVACDVWCLLYCDGVFVDVYGFYLDKLGLGVLLTMLLCFGV